MAQCAVVTGASSGIGAATVRRLRQVGFDVVAGARRMDRLADLAAETGARAIRLDVTDQGSVDAFCDAIPRASVLINNAGGALGLEPILSADDDNWSMMWETNVMGLMRMTRALLPKLEASGDGHVVNIGSIAALEVYSGGGGYTAAKHAVAAITQTLRLELGGRPIGVSEIDPGMVETEFSVVRFKGDRDRAAEVYEGLVPLAADDIADAVVWVVTRPSHVNVDHLVIKPRAQVSATISHRSIPGAP